MFLYVYSLYWNKTNWSNLLCWYHFEESNHTIIWSSYWFSFRTLQTNSHFRILNQIEYYFKFGMNLSKKMMLALDFSINVSLHRSEMINLWGKLKKDNFHFDTFFGVKFYIFGILSLEATLHFLYRIWGKSSHMLGLIHIYPILLFL